MFANIVEGEGDSRRGVLRESGSERGGSTRPAAIVGIKMWGERAKLWVASATTAMHKIGTDAEVTYLGYPRTCTHRSRVVVFVPPPQTNGVEAGFQTKCRRFESSAEQLRGP